MQPARESGNNHATRRVRVGRPAPARLVAGYFAAALACWLAAAAVLPTAAGELAAGAVWAPRLLLAIHLVALGFLPLAVTGGALHILPTLLRTDASRWRGIVALPLLCAGPVLAVGVAYELDGLLWPAALAETAGFALIAWELCALALRAPRGRLLLTSRAGVLLSTLHAAAALVFGGALAAREWRPLWGVPHERAIAIHLHLAVVGWLTLLLLAVGRTLGPMLALAPAEPRRRAPLDELALTAGLWLLLAGLGLDLRALEIAGGFLMLAAVARFAALLARVAREQHLDAPEGPLLHFVAGFFFLAQAALVGLGMLFGLAVTPRRLVAYVIALLVGWAAGATLGHLGKLLSLSLWAWWPPGPRPKQAALYQRRLWSCEAALFAAGLEIVVLAVVAGSRGTVLAGALLLSVSAVLATIASLHSLRTGLPALARTGWTGRYEQARSSPSGSPA